MQNLSGLTAVSFNVVPGANIHACIREAIDLSRMYLQSSYDQNGPIVSFEFNDVTVSVKMDSDPEVVYRDYMRAREGYIDPNVGPYPNPVLTDEEKENDARIKAENKRQAQEERAKRQARAEAKRKHTEAKLANAPEMKIANEATWQSWKDNNQDGYGGAVIAYAERWARLMQVELAAGKELEDIAYAASYEADIDSISGAMYGAAVQVLATSWEHGDQLRRWHNSQYGVSEDTKGTVNPAVLTVSAS